MHVNELAKGAPSVEARVGTVLREKWRVDRLIGLGGMAAVYEGRHHRNGGRVALKVLHRHVASSSEKLARFRREGYAANRVKHSGVVRVHDDDVDETGAPFLVMDLLEGETVAEHAAKQGGTLSPREVLHIAEQALDVLAAAHDHGVLHRDIKPDNLFLTRAGELKILDFGIAYLQDPELESWRTELGTLLGAPAFVPPEQARGRIDEVGPRADLWSLGASMFTLLTGRFVHEAKTATEQLGLAMTASAPSLANVAPSLPTALALLVDRALAYRQEDRFADAGSMRRAVRFLLDEWDAIEKAPGEIPQGWVLQLAARSGEQPSWAAETNDAPIPLVEPRRARWAPLAFGLGVLALATFAWVSWARREPSTPRGAPVANAETHNPEAALGAPPLLPPPRPEVSPGPLVSPPLRPVESVTTSSLQRHTRAHESARPRVATLPAPAAAPSPMDAPPVPARDPLDRRY